MVSVESSCITLCKSLLIKSSIPTQINIGTFEPAQAWLVAFHAKIRPAFQLWRQIDIKNDVVPRVFMDLGVGSTPTLQCFITEAWLWCQVVSKQRQLDYYLLNTLPKLMSQKRSKLRFTGPLNGVSTSEVNPLVISGVSSQRASKTGKLFHAMTS